MSAVIKTHFEWNRTTFLPPHGVISYGGWSLVLEQSWDEEDMVLAEFCCECERQNGGCLWGGGNPLLNMWYVVDGP